jgi:hypothetical protein
MWTYADGLRKVILHLGSHKTGTTSIQISLERSRSALEDLGVFLPPRIPTYLNSDSDNFANAVRQRSLGNYGDLAYSIQNRGATGMNKNARDLIIAELRIVDESTLILSGEDFATLDFDQVEIFRNLFSDEQVSFHLVYFLRHQSESLVGFYQTVLVHTPHDQLNFESFVEQQKKIFKYDEIIDRWDSIFNFASINLINYIDSTSGNPINSVQEFAHVLTQILKTQIHLESSERYNRGLGPSSLQWLDKLHPYLNMTSRESVISLLSELDATSEKQFQFLTTQEFNSITDEFAATNDNIMNRHQFRLSHPDAKKITINESFRPSLGDLIEQLVVSKGSLIKSVVSNLPFTVIDENNGFSNPYVGLDVETVKKSVAISLNSPQVIANMFIPKFPPPHERQRDNSNEDSDINTDIEQIDRIRQVIGTPQRVLHLGCKWGYLTRLLFSLGDDVEVHCSDTDSKWVSTIRNNSPFAQTFLLNSASGLPFRYEFADVVVASHSFVSYLGSAQIKTYLDEIARVLEFGGYFFFNSISMTNEDANRDLKFDSPMSNLRNSQAFVFNEQYITQHLPSELTILKFDTNGYFDFFVLQKVRTRT